MSVDPIETPRIHGVSKTQNVSPVPRSQLPSALSQTQAPRNVDAQDKVELSSQAMEAAAEHEASQARIARARQAIEAGKYDSPEVFDIAFSRMLEDVVKRME